MLGSPAGGGIMSEALRPIWSVAGLVSAIATTLNDALGACAVRGELGGVTRAASGHCYFTLKDERGEAALRCVMFRRAASLLDFEPREGAMVEVRGRVAVYEPRGELQLVVEAMSRSGAGALYEEFLRRKARLERDGLFDVDRKRPMPTVPTALGVITSPSGAVLHDICTSLARRAPHVRLVVYPALVQGTGAVASLVAAVHLAAQRREVDTLLVCRGGGAMEDLWAFNDETLVRAIAACPVPVISGVGHETDLTLCDLAADLRAPTPTAAAELATPATADLQVALERLGRRMDEGMRARLDREAQRLDRATLRLARPAAALQSQGVLLRHRAAVLKRAMDGAQEDHREHLTGCASRLSAAAHRALEGHHHGWALRQARVEALSPARVLERGYAWVLDEQGRAISTVRDARPDRRIQVRVRDGHFLAVVSEEDGH